MSQCYPVFLQLTDELVTVVGGGPIAARKAEELLQSGARLRWVSPVFDGDAYAVSGRFPDRIDLLRRRFRPGDTREARVVIAATSDSEVNAQVREDARRFGGLVNVVDVPELCDFYAGGVVRRGDVVVAVGTGGRAPALAGHLRRWLEAALPVRLGVLAGALGRLRPRLLRELPNYRIRADALAAFLARVFDQVDTLDDRALAERVERELLPARRPQTHEATL